MIAFTRAQLLAFARLYVLRKDWAERYLLNDVSLIQSNTSEDIENIESRDVPISSGPPTRVSISAPSESASTADTLPPGICDEPSGTKWEGTKKLIITQGR